LMEVLEQEAGALGIEPSKLMLSPKGAILTGMEKADYEKLRNHSGVIIMGAENSNVRINEWCFAERASLWLTGDFPAWAGSPIGDHIATNRISEWSAMRNGHMVLRTLLSSFALGATTFRSDSTIPQFNPLFSRNVTKDPKFELANPYRQGIVAFLRLVEAGVFPAAPEPSQLHGVSPVALALPSPDPRFRDQSVFHDFNNYKPQPMPYAVNSLECWNAYKSVPDYDITAILYGSTRRWDALFPTSPSGFVPLVPFAAREAVEKYAWCNRSYESDTNTWAEFESLTAARDGIGAELVRQRANMLVVVEPAVGQPNCFWQLTRAKNGTGLYFMMIMDSHALSPADRQVTLRLGGLWSGRTVEVYDQLGSQSAPLGTLGAGVAMLIRAGSARFLTLHVK